MNTAEWVGIVIAGLAVLGSAIGAYAHMLHLIGDLRVKLAECERDVKNLDSVKDDMRKIVMRLLDLEHPNK